MEDSRKACPSSDTARQEDSKQVLMKDLLIGRLNHNVMLELHASTY